MLPVAEAGSELSASLGGSSAGASECCHFPFHFWSSQVVSQFLIILLIFPRFIQEQVV